MSEEGIGEDEGPVRILSDLHLAHPASQISRVESLRPLIRGARTVIFNGDTCEQSYFGWRGEGEAKLAELKGLCEEEGASAIFVTGNHDPEISEHGWLELAEGRIFLTHGHAFCLGVAPWSPEYLRRKIEILQIAAGQEGWGDELADYWETIKLVTEALKPKGARKLGRKGEKYLLSALWPPERLFHIARVWIKMVDMAEEFMERFRPGAEIVLCGHFHRSGIWSRQTRTICNTGAFMRGAKPLVVELSKDWLRVLSTEKEGETYRLSVARATMRL